MANLNTNSCEKYVFIELGNSNSFKSFKSTVNCHSNIQCFVSICKRKTVILSKYVALGLCLYPPCGTDLENNC